MRSTVGAMMVVCQPPPALIFLSHASAFVSHVARDSLIRLESSCPMCPRWMMSPRRSAYGSSGIRRCGQPWEVRGWGGGCREGALVHGARTLTEPRGHHVERDHPHTVRQ